MMFDDGKLMRDERASVGRARVIPSFLMLLTLALPATGQEIMQLPLMPLPAKITVGDGRFVIDKSFSIQLRGHPDGRVRRAAARFLGNLSRRADIPQNPIGKRAGSFIITCKKKGDKVQKLGEDESYRLDIGATQVRLTAPNPLGVIHGLQTFLQLVQAGAGGFPVPVMVMEDKPRFPWRGLMIDVSRHFMPVEVIQRNLDGMEAVKLNVLHWHLSDDQGFRVESKRFPKFQQLASDGQYYTQEQIRDVIAYARDRGIRVVPEFDMPGHTTSWFAAYPELAVDPGTYQIPHHYSGQNAVMDPTRKQTYRFLDDFIGEMSRLFPDRYFHIGGDEVNGRLWQSNTRILQYERRRHLQDAQDLQALFNLRLQRIVKHHHKIMVGWDEILHAKLPKSVVVQSWRGQKSLADAARRGYRGILSHGYYLDLMQPAWQHYSVDPLAEDAATLSPKAQRRILGGEACMWAELVTPDNIDGRIWPRAAAIAERLWSPAEVRDVDSMYRRLRSASDYLASIGLMHQSEYQSALARLAGSSNPAPLRALADVLEPVKGYARHHSRRYENTMPLNRLVDGLPSESDTAREFASQVQRFLGKQAATQDAAAIRASLLAWRNNDERVEPILQQNPLLAEIVPLSQGLKDVATAGLQALDDLDANTLPTPGWRDPMLAMLKQAQQPQAELLDMIAPSVEKLVEATRTQ